MKTTFLIICLSLFALPVISQIEFNEESQSAVMEGVVEVENATKEQLYDRAKLWVASNLKSSDTQAFYDEETHEQIVTNGNLLLDNKAMQINRSVNFKLSLFFKEGRFKYTIDQIVMGVTNTSLDRSNQSRIIKSVNEIYEKYHRKNKKRSKKKRRYKEMEELDAEFSNLVKNLSNSLEQKAAPESSDW